MTETEDLPDAANSLQISRFTRQLADGSIHYARPEGLTMHLVNRQEIRFHCTRLLTEADLHTWLFGPAMMILGHLRQTPALHAATLAFGDHGIALIGGGGAGKSTLTLALLLRGAKVLSDDQSWITPAPGSPLAQPGYPTIKLWRETAEAFGLTPDETLRVKPGINKFHWPIRPHFQPNPVPLRHILLLNRTGDTGSIRCQPLERTAAIAALHRNYSGPTFAKRLNSAQAGLNQAAAIAGAVPVSTLSHGMRLEDTDRLCAAIEALATGKTLG
jgi:hypothetical protein